MTATDLNADDIVWDLNPLLPAADDAGLEQLLTAANTKADELAAVHGRVAELSADELVDFMQGLAEVHDLIGRAGSFAGLDFAADTTDPARGARMQKVEEQSTVIGTKLLFFELEWAEVDDATAEALLADDRLTFAAHFLRSARRYRPHLLTEPEEVVLTEKSVTGSSAWERLFDEQVSAITIDLDGETTTLEAGLARLHTPDRAVRQAAAAAVTEGLRPGLRTRAYVLNTLLADKSIDDRMRHFDSWIASRNLANEASDESVQALVEAVQGRYAIPQQWYTLKAKLLGIDQLADYDRMASVGGVESEVGWESAKELVLDAYGSFSGELADTARQFFDNPWIDAPPRPGKRPGASAAYTVPSHHPYLLLNWTSRRRDVLTLAHELGHGLHAYLARGQGVFHQSTPLTLAETASVFGETVTFGRLLETVTDPAERLTLLAANLEDQIATVFRQIAMNRFEHAMHTARREEGELSVDRLGELWYDSQYAMLGDSVEVTDNYRCWWSYIPHFIGTPGYVYAYTYGQLLALSVYARYEEEGSGFVASYLDMLRAGGSKSPQELGAMVGVDLADPGFWDRGLDIIQRRLDATIEAARGGENRVTAPGTDPKTYRVIQWSTGNVGRHALRCIERHPDLELVGLWVHSADKVGKDAGELAGLAPNGVLATNDVDALLALDADCVCYTATADLRPGEAIKDLERILASGKNVVSSSVVSMIYPPHVPEGMRSPLEAACTTGNSSCFTSGIDPGWANDLLPFVLTGACEYIDELRVMEVVNYATYAQPTVLFDTMGFGQALDSKPLLLLPGVLNLAWGGVVKVLAAGLGVELDEIREVHERQPAPRDIDLGFGIVAQGTTAAMRFEVQGIIDGKTRIVLEHVTRLADDLCPDWPQPVGHSGYRVVVTGNPTYTCDVQMMGDDGDHNTGGLVGTAARLTNAIPAVCAAPAGLLSVLDLPLIPGAALRAR